MDAYAVAGPSLALTKYWGKSPGGVNIAATPSVAVTLAELRAATRVRLVPSVSAKEAELREDEVYLHGARQKRTHFSALFDEIRSRTGYGGSFIAHSRNNFPTAAGLASSAAGMAALTKAATAAIDALHPNRHKLSDEVLSAIARHGSGSASRSIFGGFVELPAESEAAQPLFGRSHWPSFRIIAVALHTGPKPISSRQAMNRTARTSPYYAAWVRDAQGLTKAAIEAVEKRDLPTLGELARRSYLRMFGTMLGAEPPVLYWRPESVTLIHLLEVLRHQGLPVWETMDAGPQVKVILEKESVEPFLSALRHELPEVVATVCTPGEGARIITPEELTPEERLALEATA